MRTLRILAAVALLALACSGPAPVATSPTPTASVDIRRTKLDIAYSSMASTDVHKASSKKILEGAIAAINAEIKKTGGKGEIAKIDFQDATEPVNADFKKFAESAAQVKALNTQITAERFADVAVEGMMSASPDCHTYYVDKSGVVHRSRPSPANGIIAAAPSTGTSLGGPDESGLTGRLLPDGMAYITWHEFRVTANYKFYDEVRKMMDKALAGGAKAWIFDMRGNVGGFDADTISSYFLNGEPMLKAIYRDGSPLTVYARKEWRLPDQYQKPIAIILNDRGGSGPEFFAVNLRESKRATIVGSKSVGCVGSTSITNFTDGGELAVVSTEHEGAQTGTKYNNNGVPPDVQADDASAIAKAIEVLKQKI
ncbi:MAG: S41 family peptidase [Chloroflexota bacterium]